jgi:sugar porter (SP) family MFS transporter
MSATTGSTIDGGRGERHTTAAVLVSFVAALGGLLFGYDTAVISGAIGFLRMHFDLDAAQTGFAASSALLGCVAGAAIAGEAGDRLGRRTALLFAGVFFLVSALWSALPRTLFEFNAARIIGGVGVGMASMLSPLYIAEIAPASLRGRLVSLNQLAIVIGILLVYFVNYFIAGAGDVAWNTAIGWRWMFGSEALPAVLFLLFLLLIPESPRWLVLRGKTERARTILARFNGERGAESELDAIRKAAAQEVTASVSLFQPGIRKALLIGLALATLQQVTGINVFMYYAPEIFKGLGAGVDTALFQTVVVGAFNLGFTIVAIRTIDQWGRRPLMIAGSTGMGISLIGLGVAAATGSTQAWVLIFVLGFISSFAVSLGPVVWVVLSEIYPARIRGRAMAIATLVLWSANYLVSQTFPIMNEDPWLVSTFGHAFPFWLYAAFCGVTNLVVIRWVPETKGRTLEEIEQQWLTPP